MGVGRWRYGVADDAAHAAPPEWVADVVATALPMPFLRSPLPSRAVAMLLVAMHHRVAADDAAPQAKGTGTLVLLATTHAEMTPVVRQIMGKAVAMRRRWHAASCGAEGGAGFVFGGGRGALERLSALFRRAENAPEASDSFFPVYGACVADACATVASFLPEAQGGDGVVDFGVTFRDAIVMAIETVTRILHVDRGGPL